MQAPVRVSCRLFFRLGGRKRMARWMWGALNALQAVFMVLVTLIGFPVALVMSVVLGPRMPLRMAAWYWAPLLFAGAGAKLEVEGADDIDWSKPMVLVANHQSMIDIPSLFRAVPVPLRFVLKREVASVPIVGWYARMMGMVFIDRGNARDARRKLGAAADKLRGDATFAAFPEGTRSKDGVVGPFKAGALQVAWKPACRCCRWRSKARARCCRRRGSSCGRAPSACASARRSTPRVCTRTNATR